LLVDTSALVKAQQQNDVAAAQEILQNAYRTDVRPLVAEARLRAGGAYQPLLFFREAKVRQHLVATRGKEAIATGL
jgi:L-rhamnose isomerase/sugar isomerase